MLGGFHERARGWYTTFLKNRTDMGVPCLVALTLYEGRERERAQMCHVHLSAITKQGKYVVHFASCVPV